MKRMLGMLLLAGGLTGCTHVISTMPSATSVTGEAWYTEAKGFCGIYWGSKVYHCPAPSADGPAMCQEARMVPLTK